jgi:hypothetical protein
MTDFIFLEGKICIMQSETDEIEGSVEMCSNCGHCARIDRESKFSKEIRSGNFLNVLDAQLLDNGSDNLKVVFNSVEGVKKEVFNSPKTVYSNYLKSKC